MPHPTSRLAAALADVGAGDLLVVTGAGVSHASGIATFRGSDPDAVWKRDDVEMATRAFFEADPAAQWSWYLGRFAALEGARPNPAHCALAELERWQGERGGFLLVTQNIDTLHEEAGSRRLVKVHGSSDRVRCSRRGCELGPPAGSLARSEVDLEPLGEEPLLEHVPRCPACGELLRPHVLFFDEYYGEHRDYRFREVERAARTADLVLFVGTSLSVGVTDLVLRAARARAAPVISIDPAAPRGHLPTSGGIEALAARAEELLPAAMERLAVGGGRAPAIDGRQR